nr:hypothetical protein [Pseudomonas fluorescens]
MKKHDLKQRGLPVVHDHAAGIDIGSRFHVVAVPADLAKESVQTFQALTSDLERLANWLVNLGITTVAMESTGVYWIPVYEISAWLSGRAGQCPRGPRRTGTQNRRE